MNLSKRALLITAFVCLICLAAAFIIKLPRGSSPVDAKTADELLPTAVPAPTEAPLPTAEATAASTLSPSPAPTETPEPPVLVNLDYPMFEEPHVEPLTRFITADNVTFDERRHADPAAARALNRMFLAAEREGDFEFIIASAFRSIEEQEILWNYRTEQDPEYGSDPYAEPVIVMPVGCSEHVTGQAFDILCEACPHADERFESTPEGIWLAQNAHRFGFILRYPKDKQHTTGVKYEPWHFRYVGVDAAEYMYKYGLCLEEYLGKARY